MKSKKWKVEIPESALKQVPEEEREELKKKIMELFEGDQDPRELGTLVERLPDNKRECPHCKVPLEAGPVMPGVEEEEIVQIFDCPECEKSFMGEPLN